ncbi:MAG: DUF4011 domain-containing protein [Calditrichia bacterium]
MDDTIFRKFENTRKELLDLDLRNVRLNFRNTAKQITVLQPSTAHCFNHLVEKGLPFSFLPNNTQLRDEDTDTDVPSVALLDEDAESEYSRSTETLADSQLLTRHKTESLQKRLLKIHADSRLYLEERGINALYLATGFLHWFDEKSSGELRKAPLLLIPVELLRADAKSEYELIYTGEDIDFNAALVEKLYHEYHLKIPLIESAENISLDYFFRQVQEAVAEKPTWNVVPDEVHLGIFASGRFQMYKDLDTALWPSDKKPDEHPLINTILGLGFMEDEKMEMPDSIDRYLEPKGLPLILDADGSQTQAILAMKAGKNLVVQGPPGTGKSQTIANMLATAIALRKKVLFVSDKRAALEVVKRRLDEADIGDLALELHSQKATKKGFVQELALALEPAGLKSRDGLDEVTTLIRHRKSVNDYFRIITMPIGNSQTSFFDAAGQILKLSPEDPHRPTEFDSTQMVDWEETDYTQFRSKVEGIADYLLHTGTRKGNPFNESRLIQFLPTEEAALRDELNQLLATIKKLFEQSSTFAGKLQLSYSDTIVGITEMCTIAKLIESSPELSGMKLDSQFWLKEDANIRKLLESGKRHTDIRRKHRQTFVTSAWNTDLSETRAILNLNSSNKLRKFSARYRAACAQLASIMNYEPPDSFIEQMELIDAVQEAQKLRRIIKKHDNLAGIIFGPHWKGVHSDWNQLLAATDYVQDVQRQIDVEALPETVLVALGRTIRKEKLGMAIMRITKLQDEHIDQAMKVQQRLQLNVEEGEEADWGRNLTEQMKLLKSWISNLPQLRQTTALNNRLQALRETGADFLADQLLHWKKSPKTILWEFDYAWYFGLINRAYGDHPELNGLDGIALAQHLTKFRKLDHLLQRYNRLRLRNFYLTNRKEAGHDVQMNIIKREVHKKRLHMPVRKLLEEAGDAIQTLKPIFMMSPMSVSTFLPRGAIEFDLVIFDEASQVRPADAFGSIVRAKQLIVVGDERQLPPTRFFEQQFSEGVTPDYDSTKANESILDLLLSRNTPSHMLRWHYRSRHQSLIAVSNREFYDNGILIFPAAGYETDASGLSFVHLPHTHYERGKSATNPMEAHLVAKAVIDHARRSPHLTLGVVAFSMSQRDRIQLELEALRKANPDCEGFFESNKLEQVFVKNLETVQGDERDVILISIGYGKDDKGAMGMNFGPLNQDGGERRLNVLITRARKALIVYGNFLPEELDLERTRSVGLRALRNFLHYARTGRLEFFDTVGKMPESPFEQALLAALRNNGIPVEPKVGTAGCFIDIAVKDPRGDGGYLLGIECDGVADANTRSARDRDRIRHEILEDLGWRLYRIWSTDWYNNPQFEMDRLLEAIEEERKSRPAPARKWTPPVDQEVPRAQSKSTSEPVSQAEPEPEVEPKPKARPGTLDFDDEDMETGLTPSQKMVIAIAKPYEMARVSTPNSGDEIQRMPTGQLLNQIKTIVRIESPIHFQAIAHRFLGTVNGKPSDQRNVDRLREVVNSGCTTEAFYMRENFLWAMAKKPPVEIRDRALLPDSMRRLEWIAREEIAMAFDRIVRAAGPIKIHSATQEVSKILGMGFPHTEEEHLLSNVGLFLVENGYLHLDNQNQLRVAG